MAPASATPVAQAGVLRLGEGWGTLANAVRRPCPRSLEDEVTSPLGLRGAAVGRRRAASFG
jgi:hypothetical protein